MNFWKCFSKKSAATTPVRNCRTLVDTANKKVALVWEDYDLSILNKNITLSITKCNSNIYFDASQIIKIFKKDIDFANFTEKVDYQNIDSVTCISYVGILKYFFIYMSSKHVIDFQKWYDSEISSNLNYANTLLTVFNTFEFSCIYLLYIGTYKEFKNVYKFGRTDNFQRRYKELNKTYNTTFKIVTLQYIDPELLPKAEVEVNKFVSNNIITLENFNELISIDNINPVVSLYKDLGVKYSLNNKPLKNRISDLEHKIEILERDLAISQKDNKLLTMEIEKYNSKK